VTRPCPFTYRDDTLMAMVHTGRSDRLSSTGLVILNGGPQYRVGPHRQYLQLARRASEIGISCFRFDWAGEGDSEGIGTGIQDRRGQLSAAVQAFRDTEPHVEQIVFYGLCEGASIALLNHHHIERCVGVILANPWIDDEKIQAQSQLKNYYGRRLFSKAFWRRVFTGEWKWRNSTRIAGQTLKTSLSSQSDQSLSHAMATAASTCPSILYISSEFDDTREAFDHALNKDPLWQKARRASQWQDIYIKGSDHVFSTTQSHAELENACISYLKTFIDH